MEALARAVLGLSAGACVFLAFAWPFLVSRDPEGAAFRVLAIASLVAFLASLAAVVAFRGRRVRDAEAGR